MASRPEVPRPGRAAGNAGRDQHAGFGGMAGQGVGRAVVARVVDDDDLDRRPVAASLAVAVACAKDRPDGRRDRAASFLAGITTEIPGKSCFMGVASPVEVWRPPGKAPRPGFPARTGRG